MLDQGNVRRLCLKSGVKRLEKKHFIPVIIKSNLEREAITGI
jgi:hypothetical protein